MESKSDVGASRVKVEIRGDFTKWIKAQLPALKRMGDAIREFDAAGVGVTVDELVQEHDVKCPEIGTQSIFETIENTLEAARAGHRGWEAVRVGASLPVSVAAPTRAPHVITVRRTPSSGRPARSGRPASRRRTVASRGGSPRSDDGEPEPPRAASRQSVISCPIEVDLLFVGADTGEPKRASCAYCGCRTRGVHAAVLVWFIAHECAIDKALARRNRALIRRQGGLVLEAGAA